MLPNGTWRLSTVWKSCILQHKSVYFTRITLHSHPPQASPAPTVLVIFWTILGVGYLRECVKTSISVVFLIMAHLWPHKNDDFRNVMDLFGTFLKVPVIVVFWINLARFRQVTIFVAFWTILSHSCLPNTLDMIVFAVFWANLGLTGRVFSSRYSQWCWCGISLQSSLITIDKVLLYREDRTDLVGTNFFKCSIVLMINWWSVLRVGNWSSFRSPLSAPLRFLPWFRGGSFIHRSLIRKCPFDQQFEDHALRYLWGMLNCLVRSLRAVSDPMNAKCKSLYNSMPFLPIWSGIQGSFPNPEQQGFSLQKNNGFNVYSHLPLSMFLGALTPECLGDPANLGGVFWATPWSAPKMAI